MHPAAVPDGHHTAGRAAAHVGVSLHGEQQPVSLTLHVDDVNIGQVEQSVRTDTPTSARTTGTVVHVEALRWSEAWSL